MSLKNKVIPNIPDFFRLIFSNKNNFSIGGLYNAIMKLDTISGLSPDDMDKYVTKTIDKDNWPCSMFITLPILGWTIVFIPSEKSIYDIKIIHHRFINDYNTYNVNSIYFTYFLSNELCLSTELKISEDKSARVFNNASSMYKVFKLYTTYLVYFMMAIVRDNIIYFAKMKNGDLEYLIGKNSPGV